MNLHEYQSKELLKAYGIAVPRGLKVSSVDEAVAAARTLGGSAWAVKAQIHAGGRGKSGGVKLARTVEEVAELAGGMLGRMLVTRQTRRAGLPVNTLLVEEALEIDKELYLGLVVDRATRRVTFMASADGGVDVEETLAVSPERMLRVPVDPAAGLQLYQCRKLGFGIGLDKARVESLTQVMMSLFRLFVSVDANLVEINPLITTTSGQLLALDAAIDLDDNALYRHRDLAELRDLAQEDDRENEARQIGLSYVALDGDIGCMVNGAGLAMATMDLVKLHGGQPANFLDVGGGISPERVAKAFRLILSSTRVKAILVNIFGGIVRCDLVAEGIIGAIRDADLRIPVIVRLQGTRGGEGRAMLGDSGLNIILAEGLAEAAKRAVAAARSDSAPDDAERAS